MGRKPTLEVAVLDILAKHGAGNGAGIGLVIGRAPSTIRVVLKRLAERGVIEPHPTVKGGWRIPESLRP